MIVNLTIVRVLRSKDVQIVRYFSQNIDTKLSMTYIRLDVEFVVLVLFTVIHWEIKQCAVPL